MKLTVSKRAQKVIAVVAAASVLAALSACSSSGSTGSTGGDIKIGVITNVGSALSNYPDIQVGANAAATAINAAGGINGKKVVIDFCNTRGDTNQAATCGRQMVDDKVVAIAGQASAYSAQTQPITQAAKISEIGNLPLGETLTYTSEYSNPLSAGHPGNTAAGAFAVKQKGGTSFVVACVDSPGGNGGAQIGEDAAKGLGLEVKARIRIPTTGVVDYTPYVAQAEASGADGLYVVHGPVVFTAMLKEADAIGAKIQFYGSAFTMGQSEAAAIPTLAPKLIVASPLPSVNDTTNPGVAQYLKELDAAGVPDTLELRRLAGLNAWLAVHATAETIKTISGDVTNTSVNAALKTLKPVDLYGIYKFDPASLGTDVTKDKFPRIPKVPVNFLTYKDGKMVATTLTAVPDAFQYNR